MGPPLFSLVKDRGPVDFLMSASHYLNQCWVIVNWTLRNKLQWNLNRNSNIFIQENALESVVWETADILSRPQCVNQSISIRQRLPIESISSHSWAEVILRLRWRLLCNYDMNSRRVSSFFAGVPIAQQHLIWQHTELEDDFCLHDYSIQEGATIKLVLAMRGGPINTRRGKRGLGRSGSGVTNPMSSICQCCVWPSSHCLGYSLGVGVTKAPFINS